MARAERAEAEVASLTKLLQVGEEERTAALALAKEYNKSLEQEVASLRETLAQADRQLREEMEARDRETAGRHSADDEVASLREQLDLLSETDLNSPGNKLIRALTAKLEERTEERDAARGARDESLRLLKVAEQEVASLKAERDTLRVHRDSLDRENARLKAEVERLTEALNQKNTLTCVYCGQAYPPGTPTHGTATLTEHIKSCEKHPLREALDALEALEDAPLGVGSTALAKKVLRKHGRL